MTFKNIANKQCSCFVLKLQSVTIFLTNILKWLLKKIYKNVALFKGTEYCYIFDISRKWHEKYNLQKCLKIRYKKKYKNMKRSRSTYQPRGSCPALRNRCPRKLKNSSNTSEPSRSTSSENGRFSGARTCYVNVTFTMEPSASCLQTRRTRVQAWPVIFWVVWQKSARPQNNDSL